METFHSLIQSLVADSRVLATYPYRPDYMIRLDHNLRLISMLTSLMETQPDVRLSLEDLDRARNQLSIGSQHLEVFTFILSCTVRDNQESKATG
jgi:hypothetical protein